MSTDIKNGLTVDGYPINGLPIMMGDDGLGKVYYVNPDTGSDGNTGLSPVQAFSTVNQAYLAVESNNYDTIVVSGESSHTLSAPIAWTKNRITMIGADYGPRRLVQQGAKVGTSSTESSASYVIKVTGTRNSFINIKFLQNSTNAAALTVVEDGAEGTLYDHCSFQFGVIDNLDQTNAYEFLAGSDSATYIDCQFGVDTLLTSVARTVFRIDQVTTSQEFKSNRMRGCHFLISSSNSSALLFSVAANTDVLFTNLFEGCNFSASVDTAGGAALTNAAASVASLIKGTLNFDANTSCFNCTNFSTTSDNMKINGPVPTAATTGIAVTPA